jgi:serine/threonine protein kinase
VERAGSIATRHQGPARRRRRRRGRRGRFLLEAKAAAARHRPNLVTVYDVGIDTSVPFIVMELVPGKTLAELIPRHGLPVSRTLGYAIQIADGLVRAQQPGIVSSSSEIVPHVMATSQPPSSPATASVAVRTP